MQVNSGRRGLVGRVRGAMSGWFGIARFAATTPNMPPEEIAVVVLAHLAASGRTCTHQLYLLFSEGNRSHLADPPRDDRAPGYVSLLALFHVLQHLEEDGRVYAQVESHEGRMQSFWSLNPGGGTRRRANAAKGSEAPDTGLAPAPARRDTLH